MAAKTELVPPAEACRILGNFHVTTLARWRVQGSGPVYRKIGSKIFYTREDLAAFLAKARRTSTSDPGPGAL